MQPFINILWSLVNIIIISTIIIIIRKRRRRRNDNSSLTFFYSLNTEYWDHLYTIIRLWIWPGAWLMWAVGQAREGRRRRAWTDDERRPAAGGGRVRGRRPASQNRDVTPGGVAYGGGRTDGRVQVIPPQSGVTACNNNNNNHNKNAINSLRCTNVVMHGIKWLSKGLWHVMSQHRSVVLNCFHQISQRLWLRWLNTKPSFLAPHV